jgi:predicted acylesterase/phospholipase RssA
VTGSEVALVLSGGGAKTAAHVGAARALAEAGLVPVRYVATSIGAVTAAAPAAGADRAVLLERLAEAGRRGVVRDPLAMVAGLYGQAVLRPAPFRRAIESLVPARRFGELPVPLTVCVVDLDSGELLLYGAGGAEAPLVDVLCASCALPVYLPARRLDGRRCGDGAPRGVRPLEAASRLCREPVIAVDVGPRFDMAPPGVAATGPAILRAHDDALATLMAATTAAQLALWRADPGRPPLEYIRPKVERNATFRVDRVRQYAEDGYRAARGVLTRARERT